MDGQCRGVGLEPGAGAGVGRSLRWRKLLPNTALPDRWQGREQFPALLPHCGPRGGQVQGPGVGL